MRIVSSIMVVTLAITSNIVLPLQSSFAASAKQPVETFSNPSSKLLAETDSAKKQKAEEEAAQRQKKREEAAAIQKQKAEEAAALRAKKAEEAALNNQKKREEAAVIQEQKAEEAAALRAKKQEEAALNKKKAEELAAEKKKQQEEDSLTRKKKAEELATERKKQQEDAAAAQKKKAEELATERKKQREDTAAAQKKKAEDLAAEQQKKRDEIACKNVEVRGSGNSSREFGRNTTLKSCKYKLHFQGDGNFVLIDPSGKVIWATGTEGRATKLALQSDGNVVLYDNKAKAVWATNTDRNPGAFFALQRDGNFVVYNGSNPIWATNTSGGRFTTVSAASNWNPTASLINNPVVKPPKPIATIPQPKVDEIACKNVEIRSSGNRNREFGRNSTWTSCKYKLNFQGDGNLVLIAPSGKVLWATGTEGRATKLAVQSDGNVVLYDKQAKALWATNTDRNPGAFFALQRDGNFVVYNGSNPIWATNTSGGIFTTVSAASNWQGSGNPTIAQVPSPPPSSKKPPIAPTPSNGQPDFNANEYRGNNPFWNAGFAPVSTNPPKQKLDKAFLGNCTWYANGRAKQLGRNATRVDKMLGNAGEWFSDATAAGITISSNPEVGAIAQWDVSDKRPYGHVAVVEQVNSDGTVLISESSYDIGSWNFLYRTSKIKADNPSRYILP
jgi:surface antigen